MKAKDNPKKKSASKGKKLSGKMALVFSLLCIAALLYGAARYLTEAGFAFSRDILIRTLWETVPAILLTLTGAICFGVFYRKKIELPSRETARKILSLPDAVLEGKEAEYAASGEWAPVSSALFRAAEELKACTVRREKQAEERAAAERERMLANRLERAIVPEKRFDGEADFGIGGCVCPVLSARGDFYDYVFFHRRRVCFALGDIWGEGMEAALFSLRVKTLLREYLTTMPTLKETVEALNAALLSNNPEGVAITLFVGAFDPLTGELCYVNAGQTPPLLIGEQWGFLNVRAGTPLGIYSDFSAEEMRTTLPPGRTVVLYTNGVIDAKGRSGERYGYDRLMAAAHTAWDASLGAEHIVTSVRDSVLAFSEGTEREDDFALLCIYFPNGLQVTMRPITAELERMRDLLYDWLKNDPRRSKIYLACEEVFTNIVNYSGASSVQLNCRREGNSLVLCFTDDGEPFNPLSVQAGGQGVRSYGEGGMGMAIIRQIAGEIYYRTKENRNLLTLKFPVIKGV